MELQERIAAARAKLGVNAPTEEVPVEIAGELTKIVFRQVAGHTWADLTATNPPRAGSKQDSNVGYNTDAAARAYPLEYVTVDGAPVDADTWRGILEVLSSPSLKLIAAALWGLNQLKPSQRISELGKASAGGSKRKQNSPANSASPSAN